jgi:lysyl-tRNA synthetase class 2
VAELLQLLLGREMPLQRVAYRDLFVSRWGVDPLVADTAVLQQVAAAEGVSLGDRVAAGDRDLWLDLLLSHCIAPGLGRGCVTAIDGYPASQAALAVLDPADPRMARRFELYVDGVELANGYEELADPSEQGRRFDADRNVRRQKRCADLPGDALLLDALAAGLPPCSGVALGFDRVLMLRLGVGHIDEVMAFPLERA